MGLIVILCLVIIFLIFYFLLPIVFPYNTARSVNSISVADSPVITSPEPGALRGTVESLNYKEGYMVLEYPSDYELDTMEKIRIYFSEDTEVMHSERFKDDNGVVISWKMEPSTLQEIAVGSNAHVVLYTTYYTDEQATFEATVIEFCNINEIE